METYSVELAEALREQFDLRLLVLPGGNDGRPPGLIRYAFFVAWAMLFCLARGRSYRNAVFTDLIMFPTAVCHRLVAADARRVVIVHGLDLVYQQRRGLLSRAYGLFFRLFRRCQGAFSNIVANSNNTAALAQRSGLKRVLVVNPALPDNALTRAVPTSAELPADWPDKRRCILYFGRLVPRKGALWFAQSVLPSLPANCVFIVAGQAPDAWYGDEIRKCERTLCLGRVDTPALAAMIRAADAVVMPNVATPDSVDVEGFGLAAIETAALGGRLVASAIDGIVDAVDDGVTGTLLPAGDAAAWIHAMQSALSVPFSDEARRSVAAAARTRHSRARQRDAFLQILGAGS